MEKKNVIDEVVSIIKGTKGVHQVGVLSDEDRVKILEMEKEAEGRVMKGMGRGDNQGVKEALKRQLAIAFITDWEFEWPLDAGVIMVWRGKVIGREIRDSKVLEELKGKKNVIVVSNFVMYRDRLPSPRLMVEESPILILPPSPFPEIENVPGVKDSVVGSPCTPADIYIKENLKVDVTDRSFGTALIGFNTTRKSHPQSEMSSHIFGKTSFNNS